MFSVAGPGLDLTFTLFGEERGRESFSSFTAALFFFVRGRRWGIAIPGSVCSGVSYWSNNPLFGTGQGKLFQYSREWQSLCAGKAVNRSVA